MKQKKNFIRIINGKYKGRKIRVIYNVELRPTINRIRETLFNWINLKIKNSKCLDCFSGSGALGIEAISRYADSVTCIEIQKKAIYSLKKTLIDLNEKKVYIIHTNVIQWLKKPHTSYDIIFLDPPFKTKLLQSAIILLNKFNWLKENSLIYIEHEKNINQLSIPNNWILLKKKNTRRICYCLFTYKKYKL